jgi:hypothetical protein
MSAAPLQSVSTASYGTLASGEEVTAYTLRNTGADGIEVVVLDYGTTAGRYAEGGGVHAHRRRAPMRMCK